MENQALGDELFDRQETGGEFGDGRADFFAYAVEVFHAAIVFGPLHLFAIHHDNRPRGVNLCVGERGRGGHEESEKADGLRHFDQIGFSISPFDVRGIIA